MSRRFYTILILPHATQRLRKIHVSKNFVVAVAAFLIAIAVVGALSPHFAFKSKSQSDVITQLRADNDRLATEKQAFEMSLGKLSRRLATFEQRTGAIAEELGIEGVPAMEPAVGGAPPGGSVVPRRSLQQILDEDLAVLGMRADGLDSTMGVVDEAWMARLRMLAATPSIMPLNGFFSHGYGWRKDPFTGARAFHHGMDIVAPTGTPIVATADGVVTRARRVQGYGKMVHLSHGYGLATRYGHLSEILVRPGQRIRRGEIIGRVGSTGRSTGPHVHYEVFKAGRRIDPRKYLGDKRF